MAYFCWFRIGLTESCVFCSSFFFLFVHWQCAYDIINILLFLTLVPFFLSVLASWTEFILFISVVFYQWKSEYRNKLLFFIFINHTGLHLSIYSISIHTLNENKNIKTKTNIFRNLDMRKIISNKQLETRRNETRRDRATTKTTTKQWIWMVYT